MKNNGAYGQYYEYNYQNHAGFTFLLILLKMKIQKLTINVLLFFISYLVLTNDFKCNGTLNSGALFIKRLQFTHHHIRIIKYSPEYVVL